MLNPETTPYKTPKISVENFKTIKKLDFKLYI